MSLRAAQLLALGLCLAAQLASGLTSGAVLCIAEDGHLTLERPHPGRDCDTESRRHEPAAGLSSFDPHTEHCADSEMSRGIAGRAEEASKRGPLPAHVDFLPARLSELRFQQGLHLAGFRARTRAHALDAHATVVLRI